jgi:hypothetical protein
MVLRKDALPQPYPCWCYSEAPSGDYPLSVFLAKSGKGFFMREKVMAVYREHAGGIHSSLSARKKINNSILARKLVWKHVSLSFFHRSVLLFAIVAFTAKKYAGFAK